MKAPPLREVPDLPDELMQAGLNGQLTLFVGSGISMLLGLPSWNGLALSALRQLRSKHLLDYSDLEYLTKLDAKKQLSIAKQIAEDSGETLDLITAFKGATEGTSVYKVINDIGCTCVTTNYDELLSPRYLDSKDGSTTPKPVLRVLEKEEFFAKHLDEPGTVIHVHGAISKPSTMVVTTPEYLAHYDHPKVQHFLGALFDKKTVLFLGYGLEEAEVLEHILRRGHVGETADRRRFALQGFFRSQERLYENLWHYYRRSFGVHLLGYIRDHEDYAQQDVIIRAWAPKIKVQPPALSDELAQISKVLGNG